MSDCWRRHRECAAQRLRASDKSDRDRQLLPFAREGTSQICYTSGRSCKMAVKIAVIAESKRSNVEWPRPRKSSCEASNARETSLKANIVSLKNHGARRLRMLSKKFGLTLVCAIEILRASSYLGELQPSIGLSY